MSSVLVACLAWLGLAASWAGAQVDPPGTEAEVEAPAPAPATGPALRLIVLPFRTHSARSLDYLTSSLSALLAERLEATGSIVVVDPAGLVTPPPADAPERSDAELRAIGRAEDVRAVVVGSLTELAGRFSLDVRVVPSAAGLRGQTIVFTANSERDLLTRLGELAERVVSASIGGRSEPIAAIRIEGARDLEGELRSMLASGVGEPFDAARLDEDRKRLEADPRVASLEVDTQRTQAGIELVFKVVRADTILAQGARARAGETVASVEIRGNRRIETDAIRTRIRTREGGLLDQAQLARDVREIFAQGFYRNVRVFGERTPQGLRIVFEVEESPVIREISISGNDNVKSDKIKDILTLTTGSTLDYPLLKENRDRIAALYRAEGYYLAEVTYQIQELQPGSVSVDFEVDEKEKLKLRKIEFTGNEAFDDGELAADFETDTWHFWSWVTSWIDRSGTYSEPIFIRDLRTVEKKYTDAGYIQVEVSEPQIDAREEGLFIAVAINEGPQYRVGKLEVSGDETLDLDVLREKLQLEEGAIFNRSFLTSDVEALEQHFTDRGFYFASVRPLTQLDTEGLTVDVDFAVEKGPLYFIRNIEIRGNTHTVDPVIRREMQIVEGQLYSARALRTSEFRMRRLGFFEDVAFDMTPTDDPSLLDLNINVVERPTGSISFGAGFSSADRFVFTASLAEANLFGRGYGANVTVDIGQRSNRYFLSLSDSFFLGSTFSLSATASRLETQFQDFEQLRQGVDISLGHPLNDENTARLFLRYGYSERQITQNTGVNASAPIFREILQENESASILGISTRYDDRNDRFAPTSGINSGLTVEYAGLGGFAQFLRFEGRFAYYFGAPDFLFERSTFVLGTRVGWAIPFNTTSDFKLGATGVTPCDTGDCVNVGTLETIDNDIKLPLTERYFLGGLGTYGLRGFRARSIGPRRPILKFFTGPGGVRIYHPVGTRVDFQGGQTIATCVDNRADDPGRFAQGNLNGRCNRIGDKDFSDFDDFKETDVVGGNKFIASSAEYRFPISEEIGLQAVFFVDGGNAFYEGEYNLLDVTAWRYGYGGGVLWFSPFGPLQLVLGFPINPEVFEESPVFEFSVGGFGL